jgi:hypothetical protein
MSTIILQNIPTYETRTIRNAGMLLDNIVILNSSIDRLPEFTTQLKDGALPVGSVEFVREAMRLIEITEPPNMSYPSKASQYFHRTIKQIPISEITNRCFVKPISTKLFTGFIFDPSQELSTYNEHDAEQVSVLISLSPDTLVWISEPVYWVSEWRYYVAYNDIVGKARYDQDGADDSPIPELDVIKQCISDLDIEHPYTLDFGVLSTGETALVEANDAWAIGLYQKAMAPRDYLYFLRKRWEFLLNSVR